jgi:hypothetical protein
MPPRRREIPTPSWAELQPTGSTDHDTFRPFATRASPRRVGTPTGATPPSVLPDAQSFVNDEGSDAPRAERV